MLKSWNILAANFKMDSKSMKPLLVDLLWILTILILIWMMFLIIWFPLKPIIKETKDISKKISEFWKSTFNKKIKVKFNRILKSRFILLKMVKRKLKKLYFLKKFPSIKIKLITNKNVLLMRFHTEIGLLIILFNKFNNKLSFNLTLKSIFSLLIWSLPFFYFLHSLNSFSWFLKLY